MTAESMASDVMFRVFWSDGEVGVARTEVKKMTMAEMVEVRILLLDVSSLVAGEVGWAYAPFKSWYVCDLRFAGS